MIDRSKWATTEILRQSGKKRASYDEVAPAKWFL
jgi:hypothetical protein